MNSLLSKSNDFVCWPCTFDTVCLAQFHSIPPRNESYSKKNKSEANAIPLPNVRENLIAIMFIKQSAFAFFLLFFWGAPSSVVDHRSLLWATFFVLSLSARSARIPMGAKVFTKYKTDETIE